MMAQYDKCFMKKKKHNKNAFRQHVSWKILIQPIANKFNSKKPKEKLSMLIIIPIGVHMHEHLDPVRDHLC